MKSPILLIGGGGHCKACIDVIEQEGKYKIEGIVDIKEQVGNSILGYSVIGTDEDLPQLISKYRNAIISIGQIKSASLRIKLYSILKDLNAKLPVIKSPFAYISRHAIIGEGTVIMHHALVNANARIGVNCIINSKALIEHDVVVGNHCHVSTNSKLNGQVHLGDECFIGSGATIANNILIENRVIIPAGVSVFKDINQSGVYIKR